MHLKVSETLRPLCLGLSVLMQKSYKCILYQQGLDLSAFAEQQPIHQGIIKPYMPPFLLSVMTNTYFVR